MGRAPQKCHRFVKLFPVIVKTLKDITNVDNTAAIFLNAIQKSEFVVSLKIMEVFSSLLLPIGKILQTSSCDLTEAHKEIKVVRKVIQTYRDKADKELSKLFKTIEKFSELYEIEIAGPRTCKKQIGRDNVEYSTTEEYFKRTIYIPFLDHFLSEIDSRFGPMFDRIAKMQFFIPSFLVKTKQDDLLNMINQIEEPDIDKEFLIMEAKRWRQKWTYESISDALLVNTAASALSKCHKDLYPNISIFLQILCVLPVTTAEAERSFSTLRKLKTWLRSTTSENRLNSLSLLNIHRDIDIDIDEIVTRYANSGQTN